MNPRWVIALLPSLVRILLAGWGDGDDLNIKVFIKANPPWSFDLVLHSDDTVTMPAEAAGITVAVTRL